MQIRLLIQRLCHLPDPPGRNSQRRIENPLTARRPHPFRLLTVERVDIITWIVDLDRRQRQEGRIEYKRNVRRIRFVACNRDYRKEIEGKDEVVVRLIGCLVTPGAAGGSSLSELLQQHPLESLVASDILPLIFPARHIVSHRHKRVVTVLICKFVPGVK